MLPIQYCTKMKVAKHKMGKYTNQNQNKTRKQYEKASIKDRLKGFKGRSHESGGRLYAYVLSRGEEAEERKRRRGT